MASLVTVVGSFLILLATGTRVDGRCGFLLTAPKALLSGSTERMCVTLHDVTGDVSMTVSLLDNQRRLHTENIQFTAGEGRCFPFPIPGGLEAKLQTLSVDGHTADGSCSLTGNSTVGIRIPKALVYIQTDKPVYKPGQTVQIRILSLKTDLKPNDVTISLVIVKDASGARVMQWANRTTSRGLLSLSLPLATEPRLGEWKLQVQLLGAEQMQTFKVDEYVLPKFEVSVKMPSYVMVNAQQFEGEVCAKYTYGKPVKGSARVKICVKQEYYTSSERPCASLQKRVDGCVKFTVNSSDLELSSNRWSVWDANIIAEAVITEEATGISLNGSSSPAKVERNPVKIDLKEGSPDYFKPGLPFYGKGKVTKPDGTPAPGETVDVGDTHFRKYRQTYTTNENGIFYYSLPPKRKNDVEYSITARVPAYKTHGEPGQYQPYEPSAFHQVKMWYSPSGSFLQVRLTQDTVSCGTPLQANVSYTTAANTDSTFYYQVMSRGNIIWSGHKTHHFGEGHNPARTNDPTAIPSGVGPRKRRGQRSVMPDPFPPGDMPAPEMPTLPHVAQFDISIPVSAEMSPSPKLLVYYIRPDGETVADGASFSVSECFDNDVRLRFSSPQLRPGQHVNLQLNADAQSVCALGVVDKSVHLLGGNNKLTKDKVFSSLKEYDLDENSEPQLPDDYCDRYFAGHNPPPPPRGRPDVPRPFNGRRGPPGARVRRMIWPGGRTYSEYYDSMRAFKVSGMTVVTDRRIATRPCRERPFVYYSMAVFDSAPGDPGARGPRVGSVPQQSPVPAVASPERNQIEEEPAATENVVDLRTYFPETWLWQLVDIGASGQEVLRQELPHTLTEWVGSAFCTNAASGLGVSDIATVKAFQPFFVSFTLPYSVIRREKVPVLVTVFNYLSDCLVVELTMKNEPNFRFMGGSRKTKLCVCGSEAKSHTYHIIANTIGEVNITVKAAAVSDEGVCGNGLNVNTETTARDAVTRTLIVEPEGREEEYSKNSFICPENGQTYEEHFELTLPHNFVADSARAYITAIGDVMGSTLSGLDHLLRLPTGCGEQNMITFTPNIYVLQYLTHTGQLAPSVESKALGFMRVGYQRELTYRRSSGSYSAFGQSDAAGSMWLTAFVVKSFAQSREFISIDEEDLTMSIRWFKTKQLENGCFPSVGRILHKSMKGGLASGQSPAGLTAFVLIAMLDSGIDRQDRAVQDALLCLRSQTTNDSYSAALIAYALTLYDPTGADRAAAINKLDSLAISTGGLKHWEMPKTSTPNPSDHPIPSAVDIEVTAYALLAYATAGGHNSIITSLPIVQWLTKQRNAHGGFSSTQDTIVALQALAKYAALAYQKGISMHMAVRGSGVVQNFTLNEHNKLVLQSQPIKVPNNLTVTARGRGCAMFQANVRYNMPVGGDKPDSPAFELKVSVPNRGSGSGPGACKRRTLTVCTRYLGPDEASNMAIVAVKMVSGWIPDKETIKKVKQSSTLGVKRIETDHKWVNFYFDELTSKSKCFSFMVEQDVDIKNAKPAFVEVYDYYDRELLVKEKYRIKRVCGTKNELPVLTREEFVKAEKKSEKTGEFEQRRMPIDPLFPVEKKAEPTGPCPTCLDSLPDNFVDMFCNAHHGYRVEKSRRAWRLSLDLRPARKQRLNKDLKVVMSSECVCSTLQADNVKVLVLTPSEPETVQTDSARYEALRLNGTSTVLPYHAETKRAYKKAQRDRRCRMP